MTNTLQSLLCPKSVAVVGASRSRTSVGGEIFGNLLRRPFTGTVYPVNATAHEVQGVRAYPSVGALPEAVDLAVLAVPARSIPAVLGQCANAKTKAVVIVSDGFGESGPMGKRVQQDLLATASAAGMRIVGPNCLGVLNTDPEIALHATFATGWPPAGNVSVASQSGALGIALLDQAREHGLGIRHFVSLGNEVDVSVEDLLAFWENDPGTQVVLLYLEVIPNPRRFLEVARRVTRRKPVVAVKGGRTIAGARAAGSHTGAIATKDVLVDALLTQAGVVRVSTLEELFDVATLLGTKQAPVGRRVAIVTNAGGPGVLAADACEARGLKVQPFTPETVQALEGAVAGVRVQNPLDLLAGATAETFDAAIPLALGDMTVDVVLVECVPTTTTDVRDVARTIAAARRYAVKPIVACVMGNSGVEEARAVLAKARVPVFRLPESAASALASAARHADRSRPVPESDEEPRVQALVHLVPRFTATADRWLDAVEASDLLHAFGIHGLQTVCVQDSLAAIQAAEMFGWPVALKIASRAVLHKSDVGGVLLGVSGRAAVHDGIAALRRRMEASGHAQDLEGILVQPMAPRGLEMFLGASRDPAFGPAIAFGTGGVQLELWHDVVLRLGPLSTADAVAMIGSVRGRVLLEGFRGGPTGDRTALAAAIVQVSRLMEAVPDVLELDLNPLLVLEPGHGVVALDARIRVRRTGAAPGAQLAPELLGVVS
jgi:acetyl coenzyme A synthetase (ADP forming)-like protein